MRRGARRGIAGNDEPPGRCAGPVPSSRKPIRFKTPHDGARRSGVRGRHCWLFQMCGSSGLQACTAAAGRQALRAVVGDVLRIGAQLLTTLQHQATASERRAEQQVFTGPVPTAALRRVTRQAPSGRSESSYPRGGVKACMAHTSRAPQDGPPIARTLAAEQAGRSTSGSRRLTPWPKALQVHEVACPPE